MKKFKNLMKKCVVTAVIVTAGMLFNIQNVYAKNVVVVLDPGHDNEHTGASANDVIEGEVNLKIALACRNELLKYDGIDVYMTRETMDCPFSGESTSYDLTHRVLYAQSLGADYFVSMHNNSFIETAHGFEIYYPNPNYRVECYNKGYGIAGSIQTELAKLGINNRGLKMKSATDDSEYPDGSLEDYYNVIRNSKYNGFPAIIIEHAFLTNTDDANTYLKSDSSLEALGKADAIGIVNYLGLKIKSGETENNIDISQNGDKVNVENKVDNNAEDTDDSMPVRKNDGGKWCYYDGDDIDTSYTGLSYNRYGWWYIKDGFVDFTHNGLVQNDYGWWMVENGGVNFTYEGLVQNDYGWWMVENGGVNFTYEGLVQNDYGWWMVENGGVNFTYEGLVQNDYGWWYVQNGGITFAYEGIVENEYGSWYVQNSGIDFTFSDDVEIEGEIYTIEDGRVVN